MSGLYKINFKDDNGFAKDFNDCMKYMIMSLPDCGIKSDIDGILTVFANDKAYDLLVWLEGDSLNATEIISME